MKDKETDKPIHEAVAYRMLPHHSLTVGISQPNLISLTKLFAYADLHPDTVGLTKEELSDLYAMYVLMFNRLGIHTQRGKKSDDKRD